MTSRPCVGSMLKPLKVQCPDYLISGVPSFQVFPLWVLPNVFSFPVIVLCTSKNFSKEIPPLPVIIILSLIDCRLVDTFEKKSREASAEPSDEQGYPQARKLSAAAAMGLEGEEDEKEGEEREGVAGEGELNNQQPEAVSSDDDDFV